MAHMTSVLLMLGFQAVAVGPLRCSPETTGARGSIELMARDSRALIIATQRQLLIKDAIGTITFDLPRPAQEIVATDTANGVRVLIRDDGGIRLLNRGAEGISIVWAVDGKVDAVALSRSFLVTARKRTLTAVDPSSGTPRSNQTASASVSELRISPDEATVAVTEGGYGLALYDLTPEGLNRRRALYWTWDGQRRSDKAPYRSITFAPGIVAANTWDKVAVWETSTGSRRKADEATMPFSLRPIELCMGTLVLTAYGSTDSGNGLELINISGRQLRPSGHLSRPNNPSSLRCDGDDLLFVEEGRLFRCQGPGSSKHEP